MDACVATFLFSPEFQFSCWLYKDFALLCWDFFFNQIEKNVSCEGDKDIESKDSKFLFLFQMTAQNKSC